MHNKGIICCLKKIATHGKKLVNEVATCVDDSLQGLVALNPGLRILEGHRVIVRADIEDVKAKGKVTLVSGGGSGHEPAHAGYVGPGMLSAAVAGAVFASPPPTSILAAIRAVGKGSSGGTLLIVKNYTGDRLNFGLAAERAKAEGLDVDMVVIGEDCALTSADRTAGRRGLCGTVLIHKIAGALAEEGRSLQEVVNTCKQAATSMGTIGLSLYPCTVPGSGPSFHLKDDEMELGLGIHGEAGVKRLKILHVKEAVDTMLSHMTNTTSTTRLNIKTGDKVCLVVNNLGGTSVLELQIVAKEAIQWLESNGVSVERAYCGSLMTALEMAGVSLTVMHLDDTRSRCLDAETGAPGWCCPLVVKGESKRFTPSPMFCATISQDMVDDLTGVKVSKEISVLIFRAIKKVCETLQGHEDQLNELDRSGGDGDCGSTHARGAKAILSVLGSENSHSPVVSCPSALSMSVASAVESNMGGSSGALYSLFFTSAATQLTTDNSPRAWSSALREGTNAIMRYGGAKPGDRTMLDALEPACNVLQQNLGQGDPLTVLEDAVKAAEEGLNATSKMAAHAGRASYVAANQLTQPDPGAYAVALWLRAVLDALK